MSNSKITKVKASLWLQAKAELGEGPLWVPELNSFLWIDIINGNIYRTEFPTGKSYGLYSGYRPSSIVQVGKDKYLISDWDSIYQFDIKENIIHKRTQMNFKPKVRFNDGKVDPYGKYWVGSMAVNGKKGMGSLYRYDITKGFKKVLSNISISNGMTWSRDKKTMYYIDTLDQLVYAFDFNKNSEISNKRPVIEIPEEMGAPDGMTIDENGNLWIALWGGYCVICCDPVTGKIIERIQIDAPLVTSCAFGGENLDILIITTARDSLNQEKLEKYPNSGSIFYIKMDVAGFLSTHVNLEKEY